MYPRFILILIQNCGSVDNKHGPFEVLGDEQKAKKRRSSKTGKPLLSFVVGNQNNHFKVSGMFYSTNVTYRHITNSVVMSYCNPHISVWFEKKIVNPNLDYVNMVAVHLICLCEMTKWNKGRQEREDTLTTTNELTTSSHLLFSFISLSRVTSYWSAVQVADRWGAGRPPPICRSDQIRTQTQTSKACEIYYTRLYLD